jgi:D-alanyl-D-alanine carboxypeptidase
VVEAATGRTVGAELERRVFRPLGLRSTSFTPALRLEDSLAHGYVGFATVPRFHSLRDVTAVLGLSSAWAAGGIVSNGDDVTRFYAALLGGRLLPASLLHAMETPVLDARYGLGLFIVDTSCGRAYGHMGDTPGYRSVVYARPDGTRVALVMVNVDNTYVAQSELETAAASAFCSA